LGLDLIEASYCFIWDRGTEKAALGMMQFDFIFSIIVKVT